MNQEGPPLADLLRRLSECPPEFLSTCECNEGAQQLIALLSDLLRALSSNMDVSIDASVLANFQKKKPSAQDKRCWGIASILIWLLHDEWFSKHLEPLDRLERVCSLVKPEKLRPIAELVKPSRFIDEPDRREELIRFCLAGLGLRPAGESLEHARDRMTTLDSVERAKVVLDTVAAEKRAREIREAMAKKQALESASRYGE